MSTRTRKLSMRRLLLLPLPLRLLLLVCLLLLSLLLACMRSLICRRGCTSTHAVTVPVARWREPSPSVMRMLSSGVGFAHSLKSSLKYSFAHFCRAVDSASAPTQGWTFGASAELAGIGVGDAKFIRVETEGKKFWPLFRGPQPARGAEAAPSSTGLAATLRSMHLSLGVGGLAQSVHNLSSVLALFCFGQLERSCALSAPLTLFFVSCCVLQNTTS